MSNRSKMFVWLALGVVCAGVGFGVVFPRLGKSNGALAATMLARRKQLLELQAERKSFERAQKDLATLAEKPHQPDNFFTTDVKVVQEIRDLEDLSRSLDLVLALSVSGTVGSAPKAKTISDIYTIPFTMQVSGSFSNLTAFLDTTEHAAFPLYVRSVNLSNGGKNIVTASLSGNFYVRK